MQKNLFRGKKCKTSVFDETDWIYGSFIDSGNHEQVAIYPWLNGASTMSFRQLVYARMEAVKPETVGQITGMPDKNGKMIFTGDIVKFTNSPFENSYVGEVVFHNGAFCIKYKYWKSKIDYHRIGKTDTWQDMGASGKVTYSYEILGNIHDNPELLKEAAQ